MLLLDTVHILEHLIHLLKCLASGFGNAEEREEEGEEAEYGEENVGAIAGVLDKGRRNETLLVSANISDLTGVETYDDKVVEPIRTCRQRNTFRPET